MIDINKKYDKYKPSGIEWLGEIPSHWEVKKITHVFSKIGSGTTPTAGLSKYYENGELNWLQTGDLTDGIIEATSKKITQKAFDEFSTLKVYSKESLVVAMYGATIGKVGYLNIETSTNQACCVLSNPHNFFTKFGFYWFMGAKSVIISMGYGGGQPNISQDLIKSLRLPVPPLAEQTAIAAYLDEKTQQIDTAIAQKQQMITLLKERQQILIHKAVTQGLDPSVKMKKSGVEWIGDVPEHWEVTKAKFYSKIFVPERAKPELNTDKDGMPWVTTEHLRSKELFETDVTYYVSELAKRKTGSRIIKANSVIATCVGNFGLASKLNFDCIINQQVQGFTDLKINADYLTHLVGISENYFKNNATLTTIMYVSKDTFGCLPILLPTQKEQQQIVNYIDVLTDKLATTIHLKSEEISKLKEYKSSLINSVVTGKVRV